MRKVEVFVLPPLSSRWPPCGTARLQDAETATPSCRSLAPALASPSSSYGTARRTARPDNVVISTVNSPPVAQIGAPATVTWRSHVELDGVGVLRSERRYPRIRLGDAVDARAEPGVDLRTRLRADIFRRRTLPGLNVVQGLVYKTFAAFADPRPLLDAHGS
jgi:hypothetical protein